MKLITRKIIGSAGIVSVGTCLGTVGSMLLKKAADEYCKTVGGKLAIYSAGAVGYTIIIFPAIERLAERLTNWVLKEEDKRLDELIQLNEELLKKQKEES